MPLRLEIIDNYFVMTDTATGDSVIEESASEINAKDDLNNNVYLFHKGNRIGRVAPYILSDFVNGADSDNPFASHAALMAWFRQNTGFNAALGGSRAVGYATYEDDEYTFASPLVISQASFEIIDINSATSYEDQLPYGISSFFNPATSRILPANENDEMMVQLRGASWNSMSSGYGSIGLDVSAAGDGSDIIFGQPVIAAFAAGSTNALPLSYVTTFRVTGNFLANGGIPVITADRGDINAYNFSLKVSKIKHAI